MSFYSFIKSFCTSDLSRCSDGSLNVNKVDFFIATAFCFEICIQPCHSFLTFKFEVGSYPCSVEAVVRYIYHTVNDDNRDSCIFCFLKYCIPTCLSYRCEYDIVNFLLDEVTDCCQLIFLFLLSIVKDQFISVILWESGFHGFCVCSTPVRFCTYLWETNCNCVIVRCHNIHCGKSCQHRYC